MKKPNLKLEVAILICLFCLPLIGTNVKGGLIPGPPDPPVLEYFGNSTMLEIKNHPWDPWPITLIYNIVFVVVDGVRLNPSMISAYCNEEIYFSPRCELLEIDNDFTYIGAQLIALNFCISLF